MTDECLAGSKGADAPLTRTVTGAILAPHETHRLVVSDKTGIYSSAAPGNSKCVYWPLRRNGDPYFLVFLGVFLGE